MRVSAGFAFSPKPSVFLTLVGLCRLELQTSSVSRKRSNQLSYRPCQSFTYELPRKTGALSPSQASPKTILLHQKFASRLLREWTRPPSPHFRLIFNDLSGGTLACRPRRYMDITRGIT